MASLCVRLKLAPGEAQSVLFTVGAADAGGAALRKARRFRSAAAADTAWKRTGRFWDKYLSSFRVETPDASLDLLANVWLKYQALSARLWARTAYYQTGGAYGFRVKVGPNFEDFNSRRKGLSSGKNPEGEQSSLRGK